MTTLVARAVCGPVFTTGAMRLRAFGMGGELGVTALEVRSRKLDYLTDYRRMLSDIADVTSEAIMDRFAASEQTFIPAHTGDALTLYQRFAFLQSLSYRGRISSCSVSGTHAAVRAVGNDRNAVPHEAFVLVVSYLNNCPLLGHESRS